MACVTYLALSGAACGSSDPGGESIDPSTAGDAGGKKPTAMECSEEGEKRACTCSNGGAGKKTCGDDGVYGTCQNCVTVGRNDGGTKQPPTKSLCKGGYYKGEFTGNYKPGAFGFGIGESFFEVPIAGAESNGRPALQMTLTENTEGQGEFYTFTVGGGCMTGVATAIGTTNPFVARLTGDLDCSTGQFVGTLEGKYTLLDFMGLDFKFKGPLTAQFNADSESLEDGEWTVDEPPALNGMRAGGGFGTWGATWTSAETPDSGTDPCAVLDAPSDSADAGTSSGVDAGVP